MGQNCEGKAARKPARPDCAPGPAAAGVAGPADPLGRQLATKASARELDAGVIWTAVEASTDCLRILDLSGRLLFVNCAGHQPGTEDQPIGQAWVSCWPKAGRADVERGLSAARRGEIYRFEGRMPGPDGVEKWWDVVIAPAYDGGGAVTALIATSRDITVTKQQRIDSRAREVESARASAALRSAFKIAQVGGWEVDFVKQQTRFSPELCELLGSPPLAPMAISEANLFWFEDDRAPFAAHLERVRARGERLTFEGRSVGADGGIRWWRLFGEPVFDGRECVALRGAAQEFTDWRATLERESTAIQATDAMSGFLATMSSRVAHASQRRPWDGPGDGTQ